MRTMYVSGSAIHVHSSYITGHHHTDIHTVFNNNQSAEKKRRYTQPTQAADWGFAANPRLELIVLLELLEVLLDDFIFT
jgi:hypothetical protein